MMLPATALSSDPRQPRLRVHCVDGDGMEPDLRSHRDYVLVAPVDDYCGEGVYLLHISGASVLYRAGSAGRGTVRISLDNPLYRGSAHIWKREDFAEAVLGFVVADVKVRDARFLKEVA